MNRRPPKVRASSAFVTQGKLKCAGPHSCLPFNPHRDRAWPRFRVSFNHHWYVVEKVDAHEDFGWIAQSVESLDTEALVAPKVELRR